MQRVARKTAMKCSNERHNDCPAGNPWTRGSNAAPAGGGLLPIAVLTPPRKATPPIVAWPQLHLGFFCTEFARVAFP
jgi:hypothetical protein